MAKQSYSGWAFYPSLGDEAVAGFISFDYTSLFFIAENEKIGIPLQRLQIRLDQESQRIYFSDSIQPAGNIFTDEFEIFEHRAFTHTLGLREQIAQATGANRAWIKLAVAAGSFFAVFLLVAVIVFLAGGLTLRYLVTKIPTKYENDMGDKIVAKLKSRKLLADDPKVIASLEAMGQQLLPLEVRNKFKFEFHVVPMPEPTAFAVPGGKIFVTEGALQILNHEELTGVLSHELTHVVKRHALRQIISTLGTYAALKLLFQGDSAFQSTVGGASEMLFTSGFSQSLENEADDGGWNYLVAANIDPRCLPNALRKLDKSQRETAGNNSSAKLFSTHPLTSERLKRFEKKWSALKNKTNFLSFSTNTLEIAPQ